MIPGAAITGACAGAVPEGPLRRFGERNSSSPAPFR
jgi:hypothetical protein